MHKWKRRTKTYQDHDIVKQIKSLVHAQDSCACTTLLCMHNTLVHALEGPGTKAGTQQKNARGSGPGARVFCLGAGLGPWPWIIMIMIMTMMMMMIMIWMMMMMMIYYFLFMGPRPLGPIGPIFFYQIYLYIL